ncbi:MAG: hypothetical protein WC373_16390 [Smithella sp.]|jgi:hypothetical protein
MCECNLCVRTKKFFEILDKYKFAAEDKAFMNNILNTLYNVESSLSHKESMLDGTWPSSVEYLRCALANAIEIRKKEGKSLTHNDSVFKTITDKQICVGI